MKQVVLFLLAAALLFNQGCCSIFAADPQVISVDSKPKGASVKIGPYKGKTPYRVTIPRGKSYVIEVKYKGETEVINLNKSINPIYWVNILVWPGLIIDLATGKIFEYEPTEYDFTFD